VSATRAVPVFPGNTEGMKHNMSELTDLLDKLRKSAGLPGGRVLPHEAHHSTQEQSPQHPPSGVSDSSRPKRMPSEAELSMGAVSTWAGVDAKRWDRMLRELKRDWQPAG
jgi:hypothetical protein